MSLEDAIERNTKALNDSAKLNAELKAEIEALREQLAGGAAAKPAATATEKPSSKKTTAKPPVADMKVLADAARMAVDQCGEDAAKLAVKEAGLADKFADVKPENTVALLARFADDLYEPVSKRAREFFPVARIKEIITEANDGVAASLQSIEPAKRIAVYQALLAKVAEAAAPPAAEEEVDI